MNGALVSVEFASDGLVQGVRYHDGRILGIAFLGDSDIEIRVASADGDEQTTFVFESVVRFAANSVREGNVVSDIYVWRKEQTPRRVLSSLGLAIGANQGSMPLSKGGAQGGDFVFVLYCSYGAEIYAVLNDIPKFRKSET